MTRWSRAVLSAMLWSMLMTSVWSGLASAQAPAPPTCMSLLTSDAIVKVMGATFNDMGQEVARSGATDCEWTSRGGTAGVKALSVNFFDSSKIKASPAGFTDDAYFEMVVSGAERAGSSTREMLAGIGLRTAFVTTKPQVQVVVQRPDGVARIIGNNVTKAEMTALARVLAAR